MFERVGNFFRNIRIDADFPRYEAECRREHSQRADRIHGIRELEVEAQRLREEIFAEATEKFHADIARLRDILVNASARLARLDSILETVTRDYKNDLDILYEQKNALVAKKESLYSEKNSLGDAFQAARSEKDAAYDHLSSCKDSIDSWYAKSERTTLLFGNKGKKLPNHSLFGQSFGDLEALKSNRDAAYREVERCGETVAALKRERQRIGDHIDETKKSIAATVEAIKRTKSERSRMFVLRTEGFDTDRIQSEIRAIKAMSLTERTKLQDLESRSNAFITLEKHRRGVIDLEAKIQELKNRKERYLLEFDSPLNHDLRVKQHRQSWLKERGQG